MVSESTVIAVDMMGGDNAPEAIIGGVVEALQRPDSTSLKLILVGDEPRIREGLTKLKFSVEDPRVSFVHAPEVIGMDEHPVQAIRSKPKSSICTCMNLVKHGEAQGIFSAGNTGAVVGAAYLKWRMLPGVDRPAIATCLPSENGYWVLIDSGATVDCTPTYLSQFAIMGDVYARTQLKLASPKIGLLNNGTEEGKGNHVVQETYKLLKGMSGLNFVGNIEGHDLYSGEGPDVVVCDGFVGNIVLKTSEQLAKSLSRMIKKAIMSRLIWKIGALISKGAFKLLKKTTDASEVGGAPLLGVNGYCVIGHGNSTPHAAANGIYAVRNLIESKINDSIVSLVQANAQNGAADTAAATN